MPLDPNIILEASRNMPNFGATIVAGQEIARKREQENAAIDRANKFASLQQSKPEGVKMTDWLSSQGFSSEASELAKTQAETAKLQAEGNVKGQEYQAKRIENAGKILQELSTRPDLSKPVIRQVFDINAKAGLLDPELYQKGVSTLATLPDDPNLLRQHIEGQVNALQSAKDQMNYMRPDANAQLSANTQQQGLAFNRKKFEQELQFDRDKEDFNQVNEIAKYRLDDWKAKNPQSTQNVPAQITKSYAENNTSLKKINNALALVQSHPDSFGLKNMLGDTINQRLDPEGVDARALVADIGSLKIHDRSGAAVSASESPRLKPFIPNENDLPETIIKKLNNFKKEYEAMNDEFVSAFPQLQGIGSQRGNGKFDLSRIDKHPGLQKAAEASGMTVDEYKAELLKSGVFK